MPAFAPAERESRRRPWSFEGEGDVDFGGDFDRLPVQQSGTVLPALDRLESGGDEKGMPAYDLQVKDIPVLSDNGLQANGPLNPRLAGQGRINGRRLAEHVLLLDIAADPDAGLGGAG
jgi:hypothetical protein